MARARRSSHAGQLLPLDLDLGDPADGLHELDERRRRLRPIADQRREHEPRLRVGRLQVRGQLADRLGRAAPSRSTRGAPEVSPNSEGVDRSDVSPPSQTDAVHLARPHVAEDLERRLPKQEGVRSPQQERRVASARDGLTTRTLQAPFPRSNVTTTLPNRSVRTTRAPPLRIQSRTSGTGCPYVFGPTLTIATSAPTASKNVSSDVAAP